MDNPLIRRIKEKFQNTGISLNFEKSFFVKNLYGNKVGDYVEIEIGTSVVKIKITAFIKNIVQDLVIVDMVVGFDIKKETYYLVLEGKKNTFSNYDFSVN